MGIRQDFLKRITMKKAESLIFETAEIIKGIREKELSQQTHLQDGERAEQAHRHACEYDTLKTRNAMALKWEKAKIDIWKKEQSRKMDKEQAKQFMEEFENGKQDYKPYV